ncbi:MAG: 4Fe-4S binding protein, partial [Anaerolineae bacterium]|nr:4Fe-4S binding protein [Anaerolineae bacterium]
DPEHGVPYCSKICCLYTAKQALLYRQRVPEGEALVFSIDVRTAGRRYEEFAQRAMEEGQVLYLRGKVAKVFRQGDQVVVWGTDTLAGRNVEAAADLVVLATAAVPSAGAAELGRRLRATTDALGFFNEAHPKLRPVESLTAGIFLAGAAQAPKDIAEAVSQAGAAAAKVLGLFSRRELVQEPTVAAVLEELCAGCGLCVAACPYEARRLDTRLRVAEVNVALCQGCGACVVTCPNKACVVRNWRPEQALAMVGAMLGADEALVRGEEAAG